MKTLRQSLLDYDMALLEAIAQYRGVPLDPVSRRQALDTLNEAILSPAAVAIILDDLLPVEQQAFQLILDQGGQIEGPRFTRQYGVIRQMGPARLEREQPWKNPVNPAESLWYKGLIFKTFQVGLHGNVEIIYIPTDLISLLTDVYPETSPAKDDDLPADESPLTASQTAAKIYQFPTASPESATDDEAEEGDGFPSRRSGTPPFLTLTKPPDQIVTGVGRLRESMFSLLVYLQTHTVRMTKDGAVEDHERQALQACLPPPPHPIFPQRVELDFLLHLGQRAGLFTLRHKTLKPEREATRTWLQTPESEQTHFLQNCWRSDPTWNDLWRIPSLTPQSTGWENSPMLARSKILGYLNQEEIPEGAWLSLESFITAIKRLDPDFQRPNGDYESWYIYDGQGQPLMGFEYWDQVEGALIRFVLLEILLIMGVVDVGIFPKSPSTSSFRITEQGKAFLNSEPAPPPPAQKPVYLRVGSNFQVQVPDRVGLYDRFQLARFAELERRDEKRVVYLLTQNSIGYALRNGVTADQMVAFLARASNNQTPLKVVETLRLWGARQGTAYLERVTLLRLKDEKQVEEILQNPTLRPLLDEVIGPTAILVPSDQTLEVRRILVELGYLDKP